MRENPYQDHGRIPIAIVGAACRLPGAPSVHEFWDMLAGGRYTVSEASPDRRRSFLGGVVPDGERGGFLDNISGFDASFFGISPYEAVRLDPHHRLMLETVWEALEDAGVPPHRLAGTRTGVYTSCFGGQYWQSLCGAGMTDMHAFLGAHRSTAPAGRIAHLLDLRGPTIEAESTCASSLVAVHLACQALRAGEIGMAIVGGVNLLLNPDDRHGFAEAGIISPTHRCQFGDEGADGYVPSEGAVTLVLKPLPDAVADGDRVYAAILGSGVSSNGSQALSASATGTVGQEDLLRITLRAAGVAPADVDYVEAHGTGTPQGDAVELTALSRVLSEGRAADRPCLVGSVKSNIGHTEATAGLAGLLKTALALRHRIIPATLHVRRPSAVLDNVPVDLARTTRAWPDRGRPAVAGVTALGMFGIGAHVVLGEVPPVVEEPRAAETGRPLVVPLSAHDSAALRTLARSYADTLATAADPVDVCYSAGATRTPLPHRVAVSGADRDTLIARLRRVAEESASPADLAVERVGRPPRVVFVFSGQGSQWLGMARDLLATEPVFAEVLHRCAEHLRAETGWSLVDRLLDGEQLATEAEIQPALWAIQVGLAAMWRHWGIEPDLVIGHSMGEVAAATTAGMLTPRDGAAVICRRSALVGTLREPGVMVAVALGEHDAREAIGELSDRVSVAVVNSEHATVLAGDPDAVAAVVEPLRERGVYCRPVRANYASHSPNVEPLREPLLAALSDVRPRLGEVTMHSTALDRVVSGAELDAGYWMANLREPVRFASAVRAVLAGQGPAVFVEISPHPLLVPAIEDEIDASGTVAAAVPSLLRGTRDSQSLLTALGMAYERGCAPDWARVYEGGRRVPLPTYPWQRRPFWAAAPAPVERTDALVPVVPPVQPVPQEEPLDAVEAVEAVEAIVLSPELLAEHIARRVAELLAVPPGTVLLSVSLRGTGLDSVLATRLRKWLTQEFGVHVPVAELLADRPLTELAQDLHGRSGARSLAVA